MRHSYIRALLRSASVSVTVAFTLFNTSYAHANLIGSTVTGHIEVPNRGSIISNTESAVVGSQIEFPNGTFHSSTPPYAAVPVTIDFTANYILGTIETTEFTAPGAFNGYVFDFSNLSTPITNAYLDPSSSFTPQQGIVGFSAFEVTYSDPSLLVPVGAIIKIDLEFAKGPTPPGPGPSPSPVPEPSSIVLLGTGFLGLATSFQKWSRSQR